MSPQLAGERRARVQKVINVTERDHRLCEWIPPSSQSRFAINDNANKQRFTWHMLQVSNSRSTSNLQSTRASRSTDEIAACYYSTLVVHHPLAVTPKVRLSNAIPV